MKRLPGPHIKIYVSILAMIVFGPLGNLLLSLGMKTVGAAPSWAPADLLRQYVSVFASGSIWLGVGCLLTFFAAQLLVLSWADYSYVQPASAMAYGVVAVLAYFFLGEAVSTIRWVGVVIICVGVLIVGRTAPSTIDEGPL